MLKDDIFKKYDQPLHSGVLNKHLIKLRSRQCECCHNTEWLGKPINLQVHHIDGDRTNNTLENLQLLCPNCHSYTDNFGTKNKKQKQTIEDEDFINALKNNPNIRQALFSLKLVDAGVNYKRANQIIDKYNIRVGENLKQIDRKYCKECGKLISEDKEYCDSCYFILNRPTRDELKNMIRTMSFVQIGMIYKVSDNGVRKWCDKYNLPRTKKEINKYSDEEWELI